MTTATAAVVLTAVIPTAAATAATMVVAAMSREPLATGRGGSIATAGGEVLEARPAGDGQWQLR